MKRLASILCAGVLLSVLHTPAVAKRGTISATKTGVIAATKTGVISATAQTTSANRSGTIAATRNGLISPTRAESGLADSDQSWLTEILFLVVGLW